MKRRTIIATMSIMAATLILSGCNNANVEPKIVSTYHFDNLNKEVKDQMINEIMMKNGILTATVSGTTFTPEYQINYNVVTIKDCSKKEWNNVLQSEINVCEYKTKNVERTEDGHIYTDKFLKTYEKIEQVPFRITYFITYSENDTEKIKEVTITSYTDTNGTITLDIKPYIFNSFKNIKSVNISIETEVDKSKKFKISIDKKDLELLKLQYELDIKNAMKKQKEKFEESVQKMTENKEAQAKADAERNTSDKALEKEEN